MLLADVVNASAEVGSSSSRLAKAARLSELLGAAGQTGNPRLVAVVVAWLSGELTQGQIGVGWAALRSPPQPAAGPTLTVIEVDGAFDRIGAEAGKGSQALRAAQLAGLFGAATDVGSTPAASTT